MQHSAHSTVENQRICLRCGAYLSHYNKDNLCHRCQNVEEQRRLAFSGFEDSVGIRIAKGESFTVKEAAHIKGYHPGHLRRILEHPKTYPWHSHGIDSAEKVGKRWRVYLALQDTRPREIMEFLKPGDIEVITLENVGEDTYRIVRNEAGWLS